MKKHKTKTFTVFFCWQSDIPGQRELIKKELLDQAYKIGEEHNCIINIDEDTRSVAGMIPIADEVLEKIKNADIFICDISPVTSIKITNDNKENRRKDMPNSNVMLELGYALCCMHSSRIIAIANTEEKKWNQASMPFDIYHRKYVTFENEDDLDIGHELAKSIDFIKTYGCLDPNGSRLYGWLKRQWNILLNRVGIKKSPIPITSSEYNEEKNFDDLLGLAFPGVEKKSYFGDEAILRLKVLYNCYKLGNYPNLYLNDYNKETFEADDFEIIKQGIIRIGINIIRIVELKVNRNQDKKDASYITISGIGESKMSYDYRFLDNSEALDKNNSKDEQYFTVYTDSKHCRHILKRRFFDDGAIFTREGEWIDLRGKVKLRRIHLNDFEMVLSIGDNRISKRI